MNHPSDLSGMSPPAVLPPSRASFPPRRPWMSLLQGLMFACLLAPFLFVKPAFTVPRRLTVTPAAAGMRLEWAPSRDATRYRIERSVDNRYYRTIGTIAPADTRYFDRGVSPGTLYFYRVVALNADGETARTNWQYARTAEPVDAALVRLGDIPETGRLELYARTAEPGGDTPDGPAAMTAAEPPGQPEEGVAPACLRTWGEPVADAGRILRLETEATVFQAVEEALEAGYIISIRDTARRAAGDPVPQAELLVEAFQDEVGSAHFILCSREPHQADMPDREPSLRPRALSTISFEALRARSMHATATLYEGRLPLEDPERTALLACGTLWRP